MQILSRRDALSAAVTGLTTGFIGWQILVYLGRALPMGIDPTVLVFVVPVLWVLGVQLGYVLAMVFKPFAQFGKFAAIGFANAMVDFGVLYLLIDITGKTDSGHYAFFKTISFIVAVIHSYLWNRYWAFADTPGKGGTSELASFLAVSLASLGINVGISSLVHAFQPGGVDVKAWAGISAIVGSASALIFNFTGLRLFVFGKK